PGPPRPPSPPTRRSSDLRPSTPHGSPPATTTSIHCRSRRGVRLTCCPGAAALAGAVAGDAGVTAARPVGWWLGVGGLGAGAVAAGGPAAAGWLIDLPPGRVPVARRRERAAQ